MSAVKYRKGTRIGGATILSRVGRGVGALITYECDCGAVWEINAASVSNRTTFGITHCLSCRPRAEPVAMACTGCGVGLERAPHAERNAACDKCKASASVKRHKANSEAERGRVCVGCARTDSETNWSGKLATCGACDRMGNRNGFCDCGAPMFKGYGRQTAACRAGCVA